MPNPLGSCQEQQQRDGKPVVCQRPLCVHEDRVECEEGHPQPNHPLQKQLDEAVARRAKEAASPPVEPSAAYAPEPTWVVMAQRIADLAKRVEVQNKRLEALEFLASGATAQQASAAGAGKEQRTRKAS